MRRLNKAICIVLLIFSLGPAACAPEAATKKPKTSLTQIPSITPIPPTTTLSRINSTRTNEVTREEPALNYDSWEIVHDLAYSPDYQWLAVSAGEDVHIYDATTLVELFDLPIGA